MAQGTESLGCHFALSRNRPLYVCLSFSTSQPQRKALLLSVSASLFVYSLSDVIFFSTEGTAMFGLALIAAVLSVTKQPPVQEPTP